MPFLQIPSGHHQVADALCEIIKQIDPSIDCDKIDILQYGYGKVESLVSRTYLNWIKHSPKSYNWLYQNAVMLKQTKEKNYKLYEMLFKHYVKKLVFDKKPDLIICSHALPSFMLNKLKEEKIVTTPVVNVYTDYFIHGFWGVKLIDYHLVSHHLMKNSLVNKGVPRENIFVTGIPIHPKIQVTNMNDIQPSFRTPKNCLIMGGSLGVGILSELIPKLVHTQNLTFTVVCGKNAKLYEELIKINHPKIKPLPYVQNRKDMDDLYSASDLIITKPGGVTISECLMKGIPALIYHALPGQEQINLDQLSKMGLVYPFNNWEKADSLEDELYRFYEVNDVSKKFPEAIKEFHRQLSKLSVEQILRNILVAI
jgi:processive 1,2-diacylglycerol beta-glucosyltransferase